MNRRRSISDDKIVRKFRVGLKKSCGIVIWQSIEEEVAARISEDGGSATQEQIAKYFHLKRSDVSKGLAEGSLSLETLVTMLTQLDWSFSQLDRRPMPDKRERALAGYQEAVSLLRAGGPEEMEETISREAFFSLCALFYDEQYIRLYARDKLDDLAWKNILTRVMPRIAAFLGLTDVVLLPYKTVPQFQDLRHRWGKAVARCLSVIPYRSWIGHK